MGTTEKEDLRLGGAIDGALDVVSRLLGVREARWIAEYLECRREGEARYQRRGASSRPHVALPNRAMELTNA
jgi:hypothetical protein